MISDEIERLRLKFGRGKISGVFTDTLTQKPVQKMLSSRFYSSFCPSHVGWGCNHRSWKFSGHQHVSKLYS